MTQLAKDECRDEERSKARLQSVNLRRSCTHPSKHYRLAMQLDSREREHDAITRLVGRERRKVGICGCVKNAIMSVITPTSTKLLPVRTHPVANACTTSAGTSPAVLTSSAAHRLHVNVDKYHLHFGMQPASGSRPASSAWVHVDLRAKGGISGGGNEAGRTPESLMSFSSNPPSMTDSGTPARQSQLCLVAPRLILGLRPGLSGASRSTRLELRRRVASSPWTTSAHRCSCPSCLES